jgi:hypothetical protein
LAVFGINVNLHAKKFVVTPSGRSL